MKARSRLLHRGYSFGRAKDAADNLLSQQTSSVEKPSSLNTPVILFEDETTASNTSEEEDSLSEEEAIGLLQREVESPPRAHFPFLRAAQLVMGALGIYITFISYGMAQEKLYSHRAPDGTTFRFVWFLQVLESSSSILLGLIGRRLWGGQMGLCIRPFLYTGVSQVLAKVCLSLSLVAGVSFPIVTLAKSAKMVPVLMGQYFLAGTSFHTRDIVFALLLVSGTVLLSFGTSRPHQVAPNTFVGTSFVMLSLFMDGCTGGLQQQLKRDTASTPPTTFDYIYYSHMSMVLVALVVAMLTGDMGEGIQCLVKHPDILGMVAWLCSLSVLGQVVIFYVISTFDPLVCATITTTRKMCSVLLSIGFRGYHVSSTGYAGLLLALMGLGIEVHSKVMASYQKSQKAKEWGDMV